jgi:hypothetical protein
LILRESSSGTHERYQLVLVDTVTVLASLKSPGLYIDVSFLVDRDIVQCLSGFDRGTEQPRIMRRNPSSFGVYSGDDFGTEQPQIT